MGEGCESDEPVTEPARRPVPFLLRVAVNWRDLDSFEDDALFFAKTAGLTGGVVLTSDGEDINMSDLEVR